MKSSLPMLTIGLGILLLLGSVVWPMVFSTTRSWTDEKSNQLSDLSTQVAGMRFKLTQAKRQAWPGAEREPVNNLAVMQKKFDHASQELATLRIEFESAISSPQTSSSFLKWAGLSVLVAGIFGWIALKDA